MLVSCVMLGLLAGLGAAAPVAEQMAAGEKALSRAKRVDEMIVYGNHQHSQRMMKKSDPDVPVMEVSDNQLDKKATVETDVKPVNKEEGEEDIPVEGQTEALEKLMSNDENDLMKLGDEEEEESSGDADENLAPQKNTKSEYEDYNYLYDYYPWADQLRKKRSTGNQQPLTAEAMGGSMPAAKSNRVKRDLSRDDLIELLQNAVEDDVEQLYNSGKGRETNWDEGLVEPGYEMMETPGWTQEELETLAQAEKEPSEYVPTPREEEIMAIEEAKARMALVNLLEEQEEAAEEAAEEEEREREAEAIETALEIANEAPYRVEEENEDEDGLVYETIVHDGVPGVFIPAVQPEESRVAKRQYLSLVPGMRKRNSWYPEDNSGRWGAFVPESKRNAREYERLFRLARALSRRK